MTAGPASTRVGSIVTDDGAPSDGEGRPAATRRSGEGRSPSSPSRLSRGERVVVGLLAAILLVVGSGLPLWRATLVAPQYPGGLHMSAYGNRVEGDIAEIDTLNHYVGMRAFRIEDVPELALWPFVVASAVVAVAIAVWSGRCRLRRLALGYAWLVPVGVLADIQYRLFQYGHDLDPKAALRIPDFTPLVIGPTRVWNFTTWARPGIGLFVMGAAVALVVLAPRVVPLLRPGSRR